MTEFSIMLFSLKANPILEFKSNEMIDDVIMEFINIFECTVNSEIFQIQIKSLQQNTSELKNNINIFIDKYKSTAPTINKLNSFLNKLDKNEYFYLLPNVKKLSNEQIISISNELLSHNDTSINLENLQSQYQEIFKCIFLNYEIKAISSDKKIKIGEGLKEKRICRFCGGVKGDDRKTTYTQEAHAISESLGNKTIILNEECDACNAYFSKTIENDILTYLKLHTTFFGIKNKRNNISKIKGKNFEYINTGDRNIILKYFSDDIPNDNKEPNSNIILKFHDKIISQNIYKALVKFALSVIETKELEKFSSTINWIREDRFYDDLPKIAILSSYQFFDKQPNIIVYLKKTQDGNLPYAVGEFHFTFMTFVFIIPTFSESENNFFLEENYKIFWDCFKHYKDSNNWSYQDFSNYKKKEVHFNMNLEQGKKI